MVNFGIGKPRSSDRSRNSARLEASTIIKLAATVIEEMNTSTAMASGFPIWTKIQGTVKNPAPREAFSIVAKTGMGPMEAMLKFLI
jgi:hypothetical protein